MEFIKQYKGSIVTILIVVGIFYIYSAFFNTTPEDVELNTQKEEIGRDLLNLVNELKVLQFDGKIFENNLFLGLTNFEQEISPQSKGRSNPFAPLGQ